MTGLLVALLLFVSDIERAERAYRMGDFAKAMELYESALVAEQGPKGALLLNMGNCAMRLGNPALATFCYRRALLWLPGNEAVLANLQLADERLGRTSVSLPAPRGSPWLLLATVFGLQFVGLVLLVMWRGPAVRLLGLLLLVAGLILATGLVRQQWFGDRPTGVVLAEQLLLLEEPHQQAEQVCALASGSVVEVLETSPGWLHVQHVKGQGWARRGPVGVVE